jgi:hypothetical protein
MASEKLRSDDRVLAFIDLGTNSIRMSVVRIKANQAYTILREEKEIVRLGEHSRMTVAILSILLKFAEKLDRSHTGRVKNARFKKKDKKKIALSLRSEGECDLEQWG